MELPAEAKFAAPTKHYADASQIIIERHKNVALAPSQLDSTTHCSTEQRRPDRVESSTKPNEVILDLVLQSCKAAGPVAARHGATRRASLARSALRLAAGAGLHLAPRSSRSSNTCSNFSRADLRAIVP